MKRIAWAWAITLLLVAPQAGAWGNHRLASYRAFEQMPEVVRAAPVTIESLASFLKAQEKPLETLLAQQDAWAQVRLEHYPALPPALVFKADAGRSEEARQRAFLMALRMAPDARFALYFQPDARKDRPQTRPMPASAVSTLPPSPSTVLSFFPVQVGEMIDALTVLATATDEPDYGIDINLWEDSPSEWGKVMGLGNQPFGNPSLPYSSQAPFHMGFYHESKLIYASADFVKRTFPLLRSHQLSTLSALAFRTGHPYWGWRFAGMSLHYLQDLSQPFHASLAPGNSPLRLVGINALAMAGLPKWKDEVVILLSNRHLALENYQSAWMLKSAIARKDTAIELALRSPDLDSSYPPWSDTYLRDVVSAQAAGRSSALVLALIDSMPKGYISDPAFDFGPKSDTIALPDEVEKTATPAARQRMESAIAELLGNFGAHSRNALRGILRASTQP
jgi:hypothetical protein